MKTSYTIFIILCAIAGFILWSMVDTTCKPCIIPVDAPENYACPSICKPEPRWSSWIRYFENLV